MKEFLIVMVATAFSLSCAVWFSNWFAEFTTYGKGARLPSVVCIAIVVAFAFALAAVLLGVAFYFELGVFKP